VSEPNPSFEQRLHTRAGRTAGAASRLLSNPLVWEVSRRGLDLAFGLYRRRIRLMHEWNLLAGDPSILDVGCGIGSYAHISEGRYLGVDLDPAYIAYARRRHGRPGRSFECMDVATLEETAESFDLVLIVDLVHHLPDEGALRLLETSARLTNDAVLCLEPIRDQPKRIARWFSEHDRGEHMRSRVELQDLFERAPLTIVKQQDVPIGPITTTATLFATA
jgi:SAM-dependent methyltransferase